MTATLFVVLTIYTIRCIILSMKAVERSTDLYGVGYPFLVNRALDIHHPRRVLVDLIRAYAFVYPHLGLRPGQRVLDIGAGLGAIGHYLQLGGIISVSLDLSHAAIKKGLEIFGSEAQNHRLISNAASLPFSDGAFNAVVSHDVLEHLPNQEIALEVLEEMGRVCRSGQMLHKITTLDNQQSIHADESHFLKLTIHQWEDWFHSQGWGVQHPTGLFASILNKRAKANSTVSYAEECFLLHRV